MLVPGAADFQHSAVVWVDLSMECLDSCQYLLASTFLTQAIARAPHPELLLLLAEVSASFTHPCMEGSSGSKCPLFVDLQVHVCSCGCSATT